MGIEIHNCIHCEYGEFKTVAPGMMKNVGKVMDRNAGKCTFPLPEFPVHPISMGGGYLHYVDAIPLRFAISADSGFSCPCWKTRRVPYGESV